MKSDELVPEMLSSEYTRTLDLNGAWSFAWSPEAPAQEFASLAAAQASGLEFHEARVPGNFELDLERLGLLPDPFFGMNIAQLRDWEFTHVWYTRRFSIGETPEGTAELVLEGIDCCASIFLNGELLGRTDNMLVEHVFDVTGRLHNENEIFIYILPARLSARQYEYPPNVGSDFSSFDSLYIRKAPHMYGWDIMPRALSAGLWRPVSLRFRPVERIEQVYIHTIGITPDHQRAELRIHYRIHANALTKATYGLRVEAQCGDSTVREDIYVFSEAGLHNFAVRAPKLWWPDGSGEPNLYAVRLTLLKDGHALDARQFNFGIRTVRLERTSVTDAEGRGEFCFYINDERIFAKGSNWVPLDAFHSRDLERTERVIDMAVAAHCNILRCWGGNVYESDRFFELCDARGLMVWQDFAMACAMYPQDQEFQGRLAAEAAKVARRLRQHACLILWAGDNECDQSYNWLDQGDPNRNALTRRVLPGVLQREDPYRPYLPSSPYIDETAYRTGQDYIPENHLWGPRGYFKAEYYQSALCHFASEIGYHGCPSPESIRRFISPERIWPRTDNPEWNLHSTMPVPGHPPFGAENMRVELMANQVRELFGIVPDTLEDFAFASQATQAEAKKFFIERFRGTKWRRTGIIWWNLMDGWPQFSDAVVDYYFAKKLAYHYIARAQQHLALMMREPEGAEQALVAVNDTRRDLAFSYRVSDIETGDEMADGETTAPANCAVTLTTIACPEGVQRCYLLEWQSELGAGRNHYLLGKAPFDLLQYRTWMTKAGLLPT